MPFWLVLAIPKPVKDHNLLLPKSKAVQDPNVLSTRSLPSINKSYLLSISLDMAQLLFAMCTFFPFTNT